MMDLVYIWYDDRYMSKVLFTIPSPALGFKVKVTDLELGVRQFKQAEELFKIFFLAFTWK